LRLLVLRDERNKENSSKLSPSPVLHAKQRQQAAAEASGSRPVLTTSIPAAACEHHVVLQGNMRKPGRSLTATGPAPQGFSIQEERNVLEWQLHQGVVLGVLASQALATYKYVEQDKTLDQ
jgi:hypothetical protein